MPSQYKHGLYVLEEATTLLPMRRLDANIIVAVGTAPSFRAANPHSTNAPVIAYTKAEAVDKLGYDADYKKYTLCEVMDVVFDLYQVAPVVFIDVMNPAVHKSTVSHASQTVDASTKSFRLTGDIWPQTIQVANSDGDELTRGTDFSVERIDNQTLQVTMLNPAAYTGTSVFASYNEVNLSLVAASDIVGAVDPVTGKCSGLSLLEEVYPRFRLVPGLVIAPGWSQSTAVASAMAAKTDLINGMFKAIAIADLDTTQIAGYAQAAQFKSTHSMSMTNLVVTYPCVSVDGVVHHLSTHAAAVACLTDYGNDNIPFISPSNQRIAIDGMVNADGTENYFGSEQVCNLNGEGIVSCINFDTWKLFGNRTSYYPTSKDPKDTWIPVRRMFNWICNSLIVNFFSQIDQPIRRRTIDSIVNSCNTWLNSLVAREAIVSARVTFSEADNNTQDMLDGILRFRLAVCVSPPARAIYFTLSYDADGLASLFTS